MSEPIYTYVITKHQYEKWDQYRDADYTLEKDVFYVVVEYTPHD